MDRYIDNGETQKYGPELRANLQRRFGDDPRPAVRALVAWVIAEQANADQTMADSLAAQRQASGTATTTSESGSPVVGSTHRTLRAFFKHLDATREDDAWTGTLETFFPDLLGGLRKGLRPLKVSLDGALKALEGDDSVPDRAGWLKKLRAAQKELAAALDDSRSAVGGARSALSEQANEKEAWLRQYQGAVLLMEGLLRLEGAEGELAGVVPHLAAPGGRKATDGKTPNVPVKPVTEPVEGDPR